MIMVITIATLLNLLPLQLIRMTMHETHDKNALCDNYIVEFVHDATGNYYEGGKYGGRNFHVTKTPLYMLKFLKLHLFYLSMLVASCFIKFVYLQDSYA